VEEVATVADAWGASVELRNAIENPRVAHPVKRAVMGELADQIGADPDDPQRAAASRRPPARSKRYRTWRGR
jgi:hypothetical protein